MGCALCKPDGASQSMRAAPDSLPGTALLEPAAEPGGRRPSASSLPSQAPPMEAAADPLGPSVDMSVDDSRRSVIEGDRPVNGSDTPSRKSFQDVGVIAPSAASACRTTESNRLDPFIAPMRPSTYTPPISPAPGASVESFARVTTSGRFSTSTRDLRLTSEIRLSAGRGSLTDRRVSAGNVGGSLPDCDAAPRRFTSVDGPTSESSIQNSKFAMRSVGGGSDSGASQIAAGGGEALTRRISLGSILHSASVRNPPAPSGNPECERDQSVVGVVDPTGPSLQSSAHSQRPSVASLSMDGAVAGAVSSATPRAPPSCTSSPHVPSDTVLVPGSQQELRPTSHPPSLKDECRSTSTQPSSFDAPLRRVSSARRRSNPMVSPTSSSSGPPGASTGFVPVGDRSHSDAPAGPESTLQPAAPAVKDGKWITLGSVDLPHSCVESEGEDDAEDEEDERCELAKEWGRRRRTRRPPPPDEASALRLGLGAVPPKSPSPFPLPSDSPTGRRSAPFKSPVAKVVETASSSAPVKSVPTILTTPAPSARVEVFSTALTGQSPHPPPPISVSSASDEVINVGGYLGKRPAGSAKGSLRRSKLQPSVLASSLRFGHPSRSSSIRGGALALAMESAGRNRLLASGFRRVESSVRHVQTPQHPPGLTPSSSGCARCGGRGVLAAADGGDPLPCWCQVTQLMQQPHATMGGIGAHSVQSSAITPTSESFEVAARAMMRHSSAFLAHSFNSTLHCEMGRGNSLLPGRAGGEGGGVGGSLNAYSGLDIWRAPATVPVAGRGAVAQPNAVGGLGEVGAGGGIGGGGEDATERRSNEASQEGVDGDAVMSSVRVVAEPSSQVPHEGRSGDDVVDNVVPVGKASNDGGDGEVGGSDEAMGGSAMSNVDSTGVAVEVHSGGPDGSLGVGPVAGGMTRPPCGRGGSRFVPLMLDEMLRTSFPPSKPRSHVAGKGEGGSGKAGLRGFSTSAGGGPVRGGGAIGGEDASGDCGGSSVPTSSTGGTSITLNSTRTGATISTFPLSLSPVHIHPGVGEGSCDTVIRESCGSGSTSTSGGRGGSVAVARPTLMPHRSGGRGSTPVPAAESEGATIDVTAAVGVDLADACQDPLGSFEDGGGGVRRVLSEPPAEGVPVEDVGGEGLVEGGEVQTDKKTGIVVDAGIVDGRMCEEQSGGGGVDGAAQAVEEGVGGVSGGECGSPRDVSDGVGSLAVSSLTTTSNRRRGGDGGGDEEIEGAVPLTDPFRTTEPSQGTISPESSSNLPSAFASRTKEASAASGVARGSEAAAAGGDRVTARRHPSLPVGAPGVSSVSRDHGSLCTSDLSSTGAPGHVGLEAVGHGSVGGVGAEGAPLSVPYVVSEGSSTSPIPPNRLSALLEGSYPIHRPTGGRPFGGRPAHNAGSTPFPSQQLSDKVSVSVSGEDLRQPLRSVEGGTLLTVREGLRIASAPSSFSAPTNPHALSTPSSLFAASVPTSQSRNPSQHPLSSGDRVVVGSGIGLPMGAVDGTAEASVNQPSVGECGRAGAGVPSGVRPSHTVSPGPDGGGAVGTNGSEPPPSHPILVGVVREVASATVSLDSSVTAQPPSPSKVSTKPPLPTSHQRPLSSILSEGLHPGSGGGIAIRIDGAGHSSLQSGGSVCVMVGDAHSIHTGSTDRRSVDCSAQRSGDSLQSHGGSYLCLSSPSGVGSAREGSHLAVMPPPMSPSPCCPPGGGRDGRCGGIEPCLSSHHTPLVVVAEGAEDVRKGPRRVLSDASGGESAAASADDGTLEDDAAVGGCDGAERDAAAAPPSERVSVSVVSEPASATAGGAPHAQESVKDGRCSSPDGRGEAAASGNDPASDHLPPSPLTEPPVVPRAGDTPSRRLRGDPSGVSSTSTDPNSIPSTRPRGSPAGAGTPSDADGAVRVSGGSSTGVRVTPSVGASHSSSASRSGECRSATSGSGAEEAETGLAGSSVGAGIPPLLSPLVAVTPTSSRVLDAPGGPPAEAGEVALPPDPPRPPPVSEFANASGGGRSTSPSLAVGGTAALTSPPGAGAGSSPSYVQAIAAAAAAAAVAAAAASGRSPGNVTGAAAAASSPRGDSPVQDGVCLGTGRRGSGAGVSSRGAATSPPARRQLGTAPSQLARAGLQSPKLKARLSAAERQARSKAWEDEYRRAGREGGEERRPSSSGRFWVRGESEDAPAESAAVPPPTPPRSRKEDIQLQEDRMLKVAMAASSSDGGVPMYPTSWLPLAVQKKAAAKKAEERVRAILDAEAASSSAGGLDAFQDQSSAASISLDTSAEGRHVVVQGGAGRLSSAAEGSVTPPSGVPGRFVASSGTSGSGSGGDGGVAVPPGGDGSAASTQPDGGASAAQSTAASAAPATAGEVVAAGGPLAEGTAARPPKEGGSDSKEDKEIRSGGSSPTVAGALPTSLISPISAGASPPPSSPPPTPLRTRAAAMSSPLPRPNDTSLSLDSRVGMMTGAAVAATRSSPLPARGSARASTVDPLMLSRGGVGGSGASSSVGVRAVVSPLATAPAIMSLGGVERRGVSQPSGTGVGRGGVPADGVAPESSAGGGGGGDSVAGPPGSTLKASRGLGREGALVLDALPPLSEADAAPAAVAELMALGPPSSSAVVGERARAAGSQTASALPSSSATVGGGNRGSGRSTPCSSTPRSRPSARFFVVKPPPCLVEGDGVQSSSASAGASSSTVAGGGEGGQAKAAPLRLSPRKGSPVVMIDGQKVAEMVGPATSRGIRFLAQGGVPAPSTMTPAGAQLTALLQQRASSGGPVCFRGSGVSGFGIEQGECVGLATASDGKFRCREGLHLPPALLLHMLLGSKTAAASPLALWRARAASLPQATDPQHARALTPHPVPTSTPCAVPVPGSLRRCYSGVVGGSADAAGDVSASESAPLARVQTIPPSLTQYMAAQRSQWPPPPGIIRSPVGRGESPGTDPSRWGGRGRGRPAAPLRTDEDNSSAVVVQRLGGSLPPPRVSFRIPPHREHSEGRIFSRKSRRTSRLSPTRSNPPDDASLLGDAGSTPLKGLGASTPEALDMLDQEFG